LEETSVCVIDDAGAVVLERRMATEPAAITAASQALPAGLLSVVAGPAP
jgi:hypothetical protein